MEHTDRLLREQGIDLLRLDFNIEPLSYWRANDPRDRQGIAETRYVGSCLAFLDELRRRHPDMLIDTCASGGRRLDLQTLRQAVSLHRSDYAFEPIGQQCHTYGLSWIPFFGTPTMSTETYDIRSTLAPVLTTDWDVRRDDLPYERLRRLAERWRELAPYLYGDFWPLTPYSLDRADWLAWHLHPAHLDSGFAVAFRREHSRCEAARFPLRGLRPEGIYRVVDIDTGAEAQHSGRELMQEGLAVHIPTSAPPPSCAISPDADGEEREGAGSCGSALIAPQGRSEPLPMLSRTACGIGHRRWLHRKSNESRQPCFP